MWKCPNCGVNVDGDVDKCWGCGGRRPVEEPPPTTDDVRDANRRPADPESPARPPSGRWTCAKCGTRVAPGFEVCWNCGTSVDGVEDPEFVVADEADPDDGEDGTDDATLVCPKCQGEMREGFLPDTIGREIIAQIVPVVWAAGRPQSSFWTGTWKGKERYPLRAYRCEDCAYLEFYARD